MMQTFGRPVEIFNYVGPKAPRPCKSCDEHIKRQSLEFFAEVMAEADYQGFVMRDKKKHA